MPDLNYIPHPLVGTPYGAALDLAIMIGLVALLASLMTREYGWTDRFWSMSPPIFCLIVAADAGFDSARLNLMTILVTLWGVRLTYNYGRKGGFRIGAEDYRWTYMHDKIGKVRFQLMNFTFISFGQMFVVWLFTSPVHQTWLNRNEPLNWIDLLAAVLFLIFWAGEAVADQQQWNFQQEKKRKAESGEEVTEPFITSGLFAYSRHPNFFCEISTWWVFYLFAIAASGALLQWPIFGAIVLNLLFHGSTRLTETITLEKYPSYRQYQQAVPRLLPIKLKRRG